jgi:peroxiredoxin (alkyl hydroperoxide reductase subunit C)
MVIGASCDTNEVHFAWLNTAKDNGGIEGVTYPILADTTRNLICCFRYFRCRMGL